MADPIPSFLRGVSDWFAGREAADGSIVCDRHRIEHSGKVVYAAAIDLALRARAPDPALDARIRRRALRAASMLTTDPNTGASVFFPGSLDHRNAASNLIDSGACCDVLAEALRAAPELFDADERGRLANALRAVGETYLVKAVLVKEVPAQRLWGATGLASAARALGRDDFAARAKEAVALAIRQSHPDGSIPYMPEPTKHGEHVGLADITTFYHSRHVGFASYVYRQLDEAPPAEVLDWMRRALDFLESLYGRDGIKPLANEAKQWYWESAYEVASHSFDVHAFVEGARRFDEPRFRHLAALAFERLHEHVEPDGGIVSHRGPGVNFQCRDFWNGHVAWIARAAEHLDLAAAAAEPAPRGILHHDDAGIVRVERAEYVAMLRGRKQPINISFGGAAGGGSLVYFGRRQDGFADRIRVPKWTSLTPGNFVVTPQERPSFKQRVMAFYRDNRHDMRFRLYVANIERKAGNHRVALEYPLRHVVEKLRDEMKGRYASHFDVSPSLSMHENEVVFSSMLARRDGSVLKGSSLTRRYVCGEIEMEVEEVLVLDLPVRAVVYQRIEAAREFEVVADGAWRTNGLTVMFQPVAFPATVKVTYRL